MSMPRQERALEVAAAAGAEALLATHVSTVTWLTGYAPPIETGPNPWAAAPLALLAGDGPPVVVVSEDEEAAARGLGCEVVNYTGYSLGPIETTQHAARALRMALDGRTRLATETGALPVALADGLTLVDVTDKLSLARAVKDDDELERLRRAIRVCDAGQAEARRRASAGTTELEAWAAVRAALEQAIAEKGTVSVEYRAVRPGASGDDAEPERWIASRGRWIDDPFTSGGQLFGIVRDITGRKQAEGERERLIARMADDQARFEALVESLPAGVLVAEAPGGRIVYGNRRVEEILRHPVLESPNVEAYGEWVGWHPDGTPVAAEQWPLARALKGEFRCG